MKRRTEKTYSAPIHQSQGRSLPKDWIERKKHRRKIVKASKQRNRK